MEASLRAILRNLGNLLVKTGNHAQSKRGQLIVTAIWILLLSAILWGAWQNRLVIVPYLIKANFLKLSLAILYYFIALIFAAISWAFIMQPFAININWWVHARIYLATLVARRLPGTVWYIGGRMVYYKRLGISNIKTSVASSIEIIASIVTDCLVGSVMLAFGLQLKPAYFTLLLIIIIAGGAVLHPRVLMWIMRRLHRPLDQPITYIQPLIWILTHAAVMIATGLMVSQIISAFEPITMHDVTIVIGAFAISGAAGYITFLLPSSFGMSDITLAALLSTLIPIPFAAVIAVINRLLTTLFEVIFGLIFYFILKNPTASQ